MRYQSYRLNGITPVQALRDALQLETLPLIAPDPEETSGTTLTNTPREVRYRRPGVG